MKNIKLMNKIAPVGIEVFDKNEYNVGEDVESPIGIMVRSADLQNAEFGHELRAIAKPAQVLITSRLRAARKTALLFSILPELMQTALRS